MTVAGEALAAATDDSVAASRRLSVDRVAPLMLAALAVAIALLTVAPWPVGVFQDDAIYVVLAKALATGEGFRMINLPGAPHATHFPPAYPAFLAALWQVLPEFPDNVVAFKFANAMFLGGAAALTYRFARTRFDLGPIAAATAAIIGTLSVVVLMVTGVVLSEPMYMLLVIPTLLAAERAAEEGDVRWALVAGALIGVLSLVRTVGVFVLPAVLVVMLLRRKWRCAAACVAAALVFLVPWQMWVSAHQAETPGALVGKYGAYGSWLSEGYRAGGFPFARAVLAKNADQLFGFFGYITMPVVSPWPRVISLGTVLGLIAVASVRYWRRVPVTLVFLAGYGTVILAWPFEPTRFALVWWPVLSILVVAAARSIWMWKPAVLPSRAARLAGLACVSLIVMGYGAYNLRGVREKWWLNIQSSMAGPAKPIAEWVLRSTQPHDVVITDHDLIVYLYTGRRGVPTATFTALGHITPLDAAQDAVVLRTMIRDFSPRWYIAHARQSIEAAEILAKDPAPLLRYAGSIATARVYEPAAK
jgi:4-amino-4-deoxy-L-arabinose transferase-like glycosyltransferase